MPTNDAMFKFDYTFDHYLESKLKKYCKDWSFKFNYANDVLKKILKLKKESVESVKDESGI